MILAKVLLITYILWNCWAFLLMGIDKHRAKKDQWRIPERKFFIIALEMGALGTYLGMRFFHHKTQHKKFIYGIPLLLILNIAVAAVVYKVLSL